MLYQYSVLYQLIWCVALAVNYARQHSARPYMGVCCRLDTGGSLDVKLLPKGLVRVVLRLNTERGLRKQGVDGSSRRRWRGELGRCVVENETSELGVSNPDMINCSKKGTFI